MKTNHHSNLRFLGTGFLVLLLVTIFNAAKAQTVWEVLQVANSTMTFIASDFINDSEGWIVDDQALLCHTADGGKTWDTTFKEIHFSKLDFIDAYNGFALSPGIAYQTADGGHTWNILEMPGKVGASLYFEDKATGFISGYQVIYKTTDGGITWESISIDKIYFHDYFFISATNGVAAANDHEQNRAIWITTDGGSNWKNVFNETNYYIHSVWFTNESTGWAAGYYDLDGVNHEPVILESTDGGLTWKVIYHNTDVFGEGQELLDIRFKNEKEGFAISNLGEDVFTTDGGSNWTRTYDSENLDLPVYGGIYTLLAGFNLLYIAGSEGYLVKWK